MSDTIPYIAYAQENNVLFFQNDEEDRDINVFVTRKYSEFPELGTILSEDFGMLYVLKIISILAENRLKVAAEQEYEILKEKAIIISNKKNAVGNFR